MQANKALGTLLVLIGAFALVYLFWNNDNNPLSKFFAGLTQPIHDERTFSADQINNFSIESSSLDVNIIRGSGDNIVVTLHGRAAKGVAKDLQLVSEEDGDTLKLTLKRDNTFRLGFNWSNVKLTVELPDQTMQSLTAKVNSGDVTMDTATFDSIDLRTNSGDIETSAVTAFSKLQLKTNSGDLELDDITAGSIHLETNSGDIEMDQYESEFIQFDVDSGDVVLENGTGELKGEVSSGDIHLDTDDLTHHTNLKASSGDISISISKEPASLAVQLSTDSGDVVLGKSGFTKDGKNGDKDINGKFGDGELELIAQSGSGDVILK
ncbi:DUF4097 family beta strand repeat-containing protein [Paenibacillus sp. strain BS8-2]